jgi:hypothetical protein
MGHRVAYIGEQCHWHCQQCHIAPLEPGAFWFPNPRHSSQETGKQKWNWPKARLRHNRDTIEAMKNGSVQNGTIILV